MTDDNLFAPHIVNSLTSGFEKWFNTLLFELSDDEHIIGDWWGYHIQDGFFIPSLSEHNKLLSAFAKHLPSVDEITIEDMFRIYLATPIFYAYIETFAHKLPRHHVTKPLRDFVSPDELRSKVVDLLQRIAEERHVYTCFVPLTGVVLGLDKFDFGPVSLCRTQYLLAGNNEFKLMNEFQDTETAIMVTEFGNSRFVMETAQKKADVLAEILNLHFAYEVIGNNTHETIRAGINGTMHRPMIWIISESKTAAQGRIGRDPMRLNYIGHKQKRLIDLAAHTKIKSNGFDRIWKVNFPDSEKVDDIDIKIQRAVNWHNKAIHFDEIDAQFVGLAIALETLLVGKASFEDLYSTWSGITQQLADRSAFLMKNSVKDRKDYARDIKSFYSIRSRIVHSGQTAKLSQVKQLAQIAHDVILAFIAQNFKSWQEYEDWTIHLRYSGASLANDLSDVNDG